MIPLDENYRSGGIILDYVDDIFKRKLKNGLGTDLQKLDLTGLTSYLQKPAASKKGKGYVEVCEVEDSDEVLEKEVLLRIVDDVLGRYQPREVAVLAYKNDKIEEIVGWLTGHAVQAASFSSLDIRKRKIIMEVISLLQFLDSPIDDLSFANFICGNVFLKATALKPEEIFDLIQAKHQAAPRTTGILYRFFREHPKFQNLWNKYFEELFNQVGFYPLYDLVIKIYRRFDLFKNFPEETAFLARFLEAIVSVEAKGMNNIKDFIELVAQEGGESNLDILLPDYIEAVKVMTFHKSKGLGFPVVINMIYDSGDLPDNLFFEKENESMKVCYLVQAMGKVSKRLNDMYTAQETDDLIQTLNTLYVINTRAKNELYNIIIKKGPKANG